MTRAHRRTSDLSTSFVRRAVVCGVFGLLGLLPAGAAAAGPGALDLAMRTQPEEGSDDDAAAGGAAPAPGTDAPAGGEPPAGGDAAGGETAGGQTPPDTSSEPPPVVADPNAQPAGTDPAGAAEGPSPDDEYATSKEAGKGMSGQEGEKEELPTDVQVVGEQKLKPKDLTHVKTGQLGAAIGVGYGLTTAGDKFCGEFTDDPGDRDARKSICTSRTPVALDGMLGFGANQRIDIVIGVRVNLEKRDYDASKCTGDETCIEGKGLFLNHRGIGVMPGVRLWGKDNNKVFKIGGAIDIMYMFERFDGYRDRQTLNDTNNMVIEDKGMTDEENLADEEKVSDHILGFRGGPILQVDPHHNVGIYFIPAAVPSFRPQQGNATDSGWFEIQFEASIGVQARFP